MTIARWLVLVALCLAPTLAGAQTVLPTIICPLSICGQGASGGIGIAADIKTQSPLNVRTAPGITSPFVDPLKQFQIAGAVGIVIDGPVLLGSQTWWKIDWAFGPPKTGWSAETAAGCPAGVCLVLYVPPIPTIEITYKILGCPPSNPVCVDVTVEIVPAPTPSTATASPLPEKREPRTPARPVPTP